MNGSLVRLLLLEDDPNDAELLKEILADRFALEITHVQSSHEFESALTGGHFDLILADYKLPSFDGLSALDLVLALSPGVPFIFVSGTIGEDFAIEALKRGATDYVLKTRLTRLVPSVQRALSETRERAQREAAQQAQRRSETYLAEAERVAHVGWWERDFTSGRVQLSDESCRIFGLQPVDLPEWHGRWLDLIHPEDRARAAEIATAALVPGGPRYDVEYRIIRADGSVRVIHSQGDVTWDETGRPVRQFGVMQDITELRRAEQELRASEARFRILVDHASDAFFLYDDEGTVLDVNRQACESLGYRRDELIGMSAFDYGPDLTPELLRRIRERLRSGKIVTYDGRQRRKDGTMFPVEVRIRAHWHEGRMLAVSLDRDITERKRAQEEHERLRQLESDLAHMNRLSIMGELTASLAHEILHPIATARNNARAGIRFLDMKPPNLGEVKEALGEVVRDADRAKDIISHVRNHIKKASPRMEVLDIKGAINEVLGMVRSEIERKRVAIRTSLTGPMPCVRGDRVQLQQVILNLILNAVEAMGSLEEGARELSINAELNTSSEILVSIRDSGPGIDPANLDRVFAPFYTTKASGIGMGLSICRSIISAHGGRLWAEANRPRGAIFQFTLPSGQENQ